MKRILILLAVSLPGLILMAGCSGAGSYPDGDSRYEAFVPDGIPFVVADSTWAIDQRGNHRAVVTVAENSGEGVLVELPWRRPDLNPETKKILVTDAEDKEIKDVVVTKLTPEEGEILFKPVSGPGTYYIYYLPYKWQYWYANVSDYLAPEYEAEASWKEKVTSSKDSLPKAKVNRFESASRFHFWSPMELIATAGEIKALRASTGRDMVVFPEDRAFPIQFSRYIPVKWVKAPLPEFKGLIGKWNIDPETIKRYSDFKEFYSKNSRRSDLRQRLRSKFGDTYWLYYLYNQNK